MKRGLPNSSRVPIGYVEIQGQRLPVFTNTEWAKYFETLEGTSDVSSMDTSSTVQSDLSGREALQGVDELRLDVSSARSNVEAMRNRLELIEDRLA